MSRRALRLGALAAGALLAQGAGPTLPASAGELLELSGEAFGTTWHVRLPAAPGAPTPARLARAVGAELDGVDRALSTWRPDSELSRWNAAASTEWWPVSAATASVVAEALAVHAASGGAFDPTLGPLLALFGFGPDAAAPPNARPAAAAVRAARARTGAGEIEVRRAPPALRKRRPELSLDLSGIAKGHAVDAVAERLAALGATRFLVEIGGELRARGAGPGGHAWRVAVERPSPGAAQPGWVVALEDAALATSGTERNRRRVGGRSVPHLLDPRSGRPVSHALRSVSVRAERAAAADAWATALLVLGPEEGYRVALRESLAALFVQERAGVLEARATPALERAGVIPAVAGAP